jgi:hypothetical protein
LFSGQQQIISDYMVQIQVCKPQGLRSSLEHSYVAVRCMQASDSHAFPMMIFKNIAFPGYVVTSNRRPFFALKLPN